MPEAGGRMTGVGRVLASACERAPCLSGDISLSGSRWPPRCVRLSVRVLFMPQCYSLALLRRTKTRGSLDSRRHRNITAVMRVIVHV